MAYFRYNDYSPFDWNGVNTIVERCTVKGKEYPENIAKLAEHFHDTDELKFENFVPDYMLKCLDKYCDGLNTEEALNNIYEKVKRDWLYHTSFMDIVDTVANLGTCSRRKVGAVLVRNRRILATGFNGTPPGSPHCNDEICPGRNAPSGTSLSLCAAVHAEQNCLLYCSRFGISSDNAILYCSCEPCDTCIKMAETAGIKRVIFRQPYPTKMDALRKYLAVKTISIEALSQAYSDFTKGKIDFSVKK